MNLALFLLHTSTLLNLAAGDAPAPDLETRRQVWGHYIPEISDVGLHYDCTGISGFEDLLKESSHYVGEQTEAFPLFRWPMAELPGEGNILVNYVDDDITVGVLKDYEGLTHTYDGHRGTDITLYNFRQMDRGVGIYAASSGVVTFSLFTEFDRNITPVATNANTIVIRHPDGGLSVYFHMRTNANVVKVGDTVPEGALIGLVGSSGSSTDAHLHFEAGQFIGSDYTWRDPWNGVFNTLPSLWQNQEDYVGTHSLKIHDMGVYTTLSAGGNPANIPASYLKERVHQPYLVSRNEPVLGVWVQVQGQAGEGFTMEIRRPDSILFSSSNRTLNIKNRYGWYYVAANFNQPGGSEGVWNARVLVGGVEVKKVSFEVIDGSSVYPPRFPVAGRSFRRKNVGQSDTLKLEKYGQGFPVTYDLLSALSNVSLSGDVLNISPDFSQPTRSAFFQVVANLQASQSLILRDTMWYHLVDTTKPLDQPVLVSDQQNVLPSSYAVSRNYPNPFNPTTNITFHLPGPQFVTLEVHDVLGRHVATLVRQNMDAGNHRVTFDARGLAGGVYFYRLAAGSFVRTNPMLLIK